MKISVLIPFRDDGEPYRLKNCAAVTESWKHYLGRNDEIVVGRNAEQPFNRSAARNDAFEHSTGDVIINSDADTLFQYQAVNEALLAVMNGAPWVLPHDVYWNATKTWTDGYHALPHERYQAAYLRSIQEGHVHKLTGCICGVHVMSRDSFVKTGGYDERFTGWGYEDNAFSLATEALVGNSQRIMDAEVVHLWHSHALSLNFGQPYIEQNKALFRRYQAAAGNAELMSKLVEER